MFHLLYTLDNKKKQPTEISLVILPLVTQPLVILLAISAPKVLITIICMTDTCITGKHT